MLTTPSWWVNPATFATRLTQYNIDQKRLGDSALPPPVRDYLHQLEREQHAADSEIVTKPSR